jgi:hypothetical protein
MVKRELSDFFVVSLKAHFLDLNVRCLETLHDAAIACFSRKRLNFSCPHQPTHTLPQTMVQFAMLTPLTHTGCDANDGSNSSGRITSSTAVIDQRTMYRKMENRDPR